MTLLTTIFIAMTLLVACPSVAGAAATEVAIHAPDGSLLGVLRSSSDGRTLLLRRQGQENAIGECSDDRLGSWPAPDRTITALVYRRNCGATVDYATHVVLSRGTRESPVVVFRGRPRVAPAWIGRSLQVTHSPVPAEWVFQQLASASGISVTYMSQGSPEPLTSQEKLDLSNLNYGATGLAAGLPEELLLRWAGWAQQASGMYRPEWGAWTGAVPYGIAPAALQKIKEGFRYYDEGRSRK